MHGLAVLKVHAHKAEFVILTAAHRFVPTYISFDPEKSQAAIFKRRVVIVVYIVEPYDLIAALQQTPAYERTYEPGRAGYQNLQHL